MPRAARVGAVQHQVRHLVRVAHRVGHRHRTALRHADQREAAQAQAVHHGFEVTHPGVEREVGHRVVGQAAATQVVADVLVIAREFGQPGPPDGAVQILFDVAQPVRRAQQGRAAADGRDGDACAIGRAAKAQALAQEDLLGEKLRDLSLLYAETESYRKPKYPAVSCACGNPKVTKEWEDDLGAFYFFVECIKCNHYWEGPIYVMAIDEFE